MSPRQIVQQVSNRLLILGFFAALGLAWVALLFHWGNAPCPFENRRLAAAPDFTTQDLAQLRGQVEAYLQDHLPFRTPLINAYAYVEHQCLGLSNDSVVIGKDGFLFYDGGGCQTLDYMGQAPFSAAELDQWALFLQRRHAYLAARHCRYLFVIAPNAASVYPEKLPDDVAANKGTCRREQLLRHLTARGSAVPVLDLVPDLCDAKRTGPVFYRADSHWNGLGCHFAMQSICRRLQDWFPEIEWKPLGTDYRLETSEAPAGLWFMLGCSPRSLPPELYLVRCQPPVCSRTAAVLPANWPAQLWMPVRTERSAPRAPCRAPCTHGRGRRLVVLGDSYTRAGPKSLDERPLGDCFQRAVFLANPTAERVRHSHLESLVYQEAPDVVVEEVAERNIQLAPDAAAMAPPQPDIGPSLAVSSRKRLGGDGSIPK